MAADARVLWVTGAGTGMGRSSAIEAARSGWRVALSGRRAEPLAAVAREIEATGGEAMALPTDVTDQAAVAAARDAILERWGRIDGVVTSAGLNDPQRTWADQGLDRFDAILQTNLVATVRVIDASLPSLRESGGTVVMISSYSAWSFSPGSGVAYSASKTALGSASRMLNQQEKSHGVRCCHLCPGDVDSDFLSMRPSVPDAAARSVMLSPDDVGRAVAFVLDSPPHVRIDELVVSPVSQG
ncbi:short-chain dehydrogenase [Frondihabitans sp. PAMC 28766]|uniref:SDR family oxidoreductase n=1 Tax=Frondihabitans sp. PAMC 28766 TaxID=1795630 RepID=UPI00078CA394|nr:SDR family NAD(P)-dependent oxidoreductase [Frondihabitans sp. PAMC 28766]AMM22123.1 short-chain dehydrogenase [Frondihabitans sp. PAMC 28766]